VLRLSPQHRFQSSGNYLSQARPCPYAWVPPSSCRARLSPPLCAAPAFPRPVMPRPVPGAHPRLSVLQLHPARRSGFRRPVFGAPPLLASTSMPLITANFTKLALLASGKGQRQGSCDVDRARRRLSARELRKGRCCSIDDAERRLNPDCGRLCQPTLAKVAPIKRPRRRSNVWSLLAHIWSKSDQDRWC
jgi:hypothetical protein